ncbi:GPW/gp25 family protein [uncultured Deefgea sp.]|uniref:GPW/gp25 family protein n=1 Tax=uncultured Deefgea sp. TaxID=1304914 RepID=UPI00262468B7|nr:GPW/gp25 family protein [uncultured Deefgea sp.]
MDVAEIQSSEWSMELGQFDQVVEAFADVDQCLRIIVRTPKGSDPHRPLFGCDIWQHLDKPINQVRPLVIRELIDALSIWEPRIVLLRIEVEAADLHWLNFKIVWQPAVGGEPRQTEVFYRE